ncbi:DUF58 domain-containing protein [Bacillus subtilis]|uniref:DUF58 domain-containing protein n=1 Tax=Pseudochrobactrum asaccharolyticum TaxID=354351 RepID=UPI001F204F76|nr:DUF58 domain-containing protein [Pseudochrobactrum asaccharolyticum]MCF7646497.1 DUF58 domain-containing protein [Pseudochrobactrum asaccharolyticum]MCF7672279.1 DUF58 domain-containing protein [Bacillus subtilis]
MAATGTITSPEQAIDLLSPSRQQAALMPDLITQARHIAGSVINGWHGRRKRGTGDNFWQFRPYAQGDMLSRIDWRRSARDDHTYMRDREWETAHTIWLWCDPSPSMLYQSRFSPVSKQHRALVLTLALAELFSRSGERIAYPEIMPPLLARNGAERLATALLQQKTVSAEPDLQSLQRFNELVLISDFLQPADILSAKLDQIARRGIRAHLIAVADPAEADFPFAGRTEFRDPVSGAVLIAGQAQTYAEEYRRLYQAQREFLRETCTKFGWSFITSPTDKPAAQALTTLHGFLAQSHTLSGGAF